jgi:excinuclease ABC subunit C
MLNITTINDIPQKPGVYLFKDKSGKILYIGKAKNLSRRVSSYFAKGRDLSYKSSLVFLHYLYDPFL